jgi:hypothetical protein
MSKSKRASAQSVSPVIPFRKLTSVGTANQDCIDDLRHLLKQAEAGELIGYAIAAMYKRRSYVVNMFGEAERNPTFARGMVRALDDYLGELVMNGVNHD